MKPIFNEKPQTLQHGLRKSQLCNIPFLTQCKNSNTFRSLVSQIVLTFILFQRRKNRKMICSMDREPLENHLKVQETYFPHKMLRPPLSNFNFGLSWFFPEFHGSYQNPLFQFPCKFFFSDKNWKRQNVMVMKWMKCLLGAELRSVFYESFSEKNLFFLFNLASYS